MLSEWEKKTFEEIAYIERGKFSVRPRNDPGYYGGSIPFIQTGDISRANNYIREYKQTLNEKGLRISKLFPKGTIVVGIIANIGDVAILDFDAAFPDNIVGITSKDNVDSAWLFQILKNMKNTFEKLSTKNAQKSLSLEKLQPIIISVPPLLEQQKIASILCTWDKAIWELQKLYAAKEKNIKHLLKIFLRIKQ